MEDIVAEKVYADTKTTIQNYVSAEYLGNEFKENLKELYQSMTVENARTVGNQVKELYDNEIRTIRCQNDIYHLKFFGIVVLVGLTTGLLGWIGEKIAKKGGIFNQFSNWFMNVGTVTTLFGFCCIFAIGH